MALTSALLLAGLAHPRALRNDGPTGSYELLHVFAGADGFGPTGALIQAADGAFYGTTALGVDDTSCGTVFRMDGAGDVTTLHAFTGPDGCVPFGALLAATDGNFYGTTYGGGQGQAGTIFKISSDGTFDVLHDFAGGTGDGAAPIGTLIQATDGAIYGTTTEGGAAGLGTAFKIDLAGQITILHSFGVESSDGTHPWAGLIQASDGNFYGATTGGGNPNPVECGCNDKIPSGTVFAMDASGNVTIRYNFNGEDGAKPFASLLEVDGVLYGTASAGGDFADGDAHPGGVLFVMPLDDKLEPRYMFGGDPLVGELPIGGLIKGTDGNLYGTTNVGGELIGGTVFRVDPTFDVTVIHAFEYDTSGTSVQPDAFPMAPLLQATDGKLYGTASGIVRFEYPVVPGGLFRISLSNKADQTISFDALGDRTYGENPFNVTATASSSLPVSFDAAGNCTVSNGLVSLTGAGSCTITASQDGNDEFNAASSVDRTFTIAKATTTLTLSNLFQAADGTPKPVTVTTNPAGLPGVSVTYDGSATAPSQPGTYAVVASMDSANYQATNANGTLTITGAAARLAVTVAPASLTGGTTVTGTVTLTSPAPAGGAVVQLSSSAPGTASVPATVAIMKGKTTKTFTITTFATPSVANVIVSAAYSGNTATALLVVNPPLVTSVTLNPTSVTGSKTSVATVTLSAPAPAGGAAVSLSSSHSIAHVPVGVIIPAGQRTGQFTITTDSVPAAVTATISARYQGVVTSANLTVLPAALSSLRLIPTTVSGGSSAGAEIILTAPAPAGGVVITISSNKPTVAPNQTVTVAAGETGGLTTITTNRVTAKTSVILTASFGGVTKTATLTVTK